jgi:hypothetical protein
MRLLLISLSSLLWHNVAAELSDPMITAAPMRPTHENLRRQSMILDREQKFGRNAAGTTNTDDWDAIEARLAYCYGERSICAETNELYHECDQAVGQPRNETKMFTCQCEGGYFAADQE